ncbi:MAG: cytochrome c biogenesis protein ResB [Desulfuromonadaceae bacterium]|nr:cytochrome c biogenesis protein ResB [Desulfuromonas sp.]MDY0184511.1 cytochrome c biogenesis protein ResB [Desulfuromonadaceae bacterium]
MTQKKRGFLMALWDFFCSLKLSIFTLIMLAVTSIIGTVLQQNQTKEQYLHVFSPKTYAILDKMQMFDMYHSTWFIGLLMLFCVNLICCSIKRLPRVWKIVTKPTLVPSQAVLDAFPNTVERTVRGSLSEIRPRMEVFVKDNFAATRSTETDDGVYLYAEKNKYARFGVYVTHMSILIIFTGAIIGNVFGYKAYVNIPEGGSIDKVWLRSGEPVDLGFKVTCEAFSVSYYPDSQRPKEYKSILTVEEDGVVVVDKRPIIVNDPMTHNGITFYQSNFGPAGSEIMTVKAKLRGEDKAQVYTLRRGEKAQLPDGTSITAADFTTSYRNFGPAARLNVRKQGEDEISVIVFKNFPEFDQQRKGTYLFSLEDFTQRYYTGLQATKDPGVWVVWLGCTLMVIGSLIAFFVSHQRMWVVLREKDGKVQVRLVGTAHRNQPAYELYFDKLKEAFNKHLA